MKRLPTLFVALALTGVAAAGCSKAADVAVPGVNTNTDQIANDAAKCAELATTWSGMFTPLATGTGTLTDADKDKVVKAAEDFKTKVPDAVKKEVDVIAKGIKDSKDMTEVAKFLGTPEYTGSFQKVTTYVTTDCAKVGG